MSTNRFNYNKPKPKNNKSLRVLIFGLGLNGGGVGSAKFFSRQGAKVLVTDLKNKRLLAASLAKLAPFPNIKYALGKHQLNDFLSSDLIVKNPAIPWNNPYLRQAQAKGVPITTDVMVFFEQTPALTIGITGTKGKSTTATLLTKILKKKYRRVWLLGNIRESLLENLPQIKPNDIIVAELSSFQLEDLAFIKKSPQIAIITNIFPDHLNRYGSMGKYSQAKANIFKYQNSSDHLIINGNDKFLVNLAKSTKARKHFIKNENLSPWEINIALAMEAAKILKVPENKIQETIKNFRGITGRQELIRKFKNRIFINDTTATNPTAVSMALQFSAKKYQRPIILIAGGQNKNLDYRKIAGEINKKTKSLILLPGSATEELKKFLKINFSEAKNMKEAVKKAYKTSQAGDLILLSPGAASFNIFQNEFDRGDQFNKYVKELIN